MDEISSCRFTTSFCTFLVLQEEWELLLIDDSGSKNCACKVKKKKQYSMANNQEKSHELLIFKKKNIILHLFLRNLEIFITFAGKEQYNALLGMEVKYEIRQTV